ncbi:M23 family metallopeptidase (plasmid) [Veillonella rogosae]|uniref:M23 family metallopeptidase n=1 Tax=Veillonella rogosae TaxID=423477 RepID=A0AA47AG46_9FIRM|nr:M23 family metallopeptidase [Veillonella rogosae]UZG51989.1 M23 family metallopeptidase [Veillonella rogosae]
MKQLHKILSILILIVSCCTSIAYADSIPHSGNGWFGGPVTSQYGPRIHPVTGNVYSFHYGIDLGIPAGVKAPAAADGTVTFAGWSDGYGNYVVVEMADGTSFAYGHLDDIWVNVGDIVKKGDIVGLVGNTGVSTGPHMHIEHIVNGERVDPYDFYIKAGWTLDGAVPYEMGQKKGSFRDKVIDFQAYFNMTFEAANIFANILIAVTKAINLVQKYALSLLLALIMLDIIIRYTYALFTKNKQGFIQSFTTRLIHYSLITILILSWSTIAELIKNFSFNVADTTYTGIYNNEYLIADPSILFLQVGHLYQEYINQSTIGIITMASSSVQSVLLSLPIVSDIFYYYYALIMGIFTLTILFAAYIVCYISWNFVYFYLTTLFCLVGLPFSAFKITKKQPAMMYKSLGLQALHLAVIAVTFNMMYTYMTTLSQNEVSIGSLLYCMVHMGCLAVFFPIITNKLNSAFSG